MVGRKEFTPEFGISQHPPNPASVFVISVLLKEVAKSQTRSVIPRGQEDGSPQLDRTRALEARIRDGEILERVHREPDYEPSERCLLRPN